MGDGTPSKWPNFIHGLYIGVIRSPPVSPSSKYSKGRPAIENREVSGPFQGGCPPPIPTSRTKHRNVSTWLVHKDTENINLLIIRSLLGSTILSLKLTVLPSNSMTFRNNITPCKIRKWPGWSYPHFHPRDPLTETENGFLEPKYLSEEVILHPNHHLTRGLDP